MADISGGRTFICKECGYFVQLEYWDKDIYKCNRCNSGCFIMVAHEEGKRFSRKKLLKENK
jgi:hypothetical protein